jgi:hypothetical protein
MKVLQTLGRKARKKPDQLSHWKREGEETRGSSLDRDELGIGEVPRFHAGGNSLPGSLGRGKGARFGNWKREN